MLIYDDWVFWGAVLGARRLLADLGAVIVRLDNLDGTAFGIVRLDNLGAVIVRRLGAGLLDNLGAGTAFPSLLRR